MIVVVSIKGMEALPADQRRSNEACKSFSDAIFFIKQILIFLGKFGPFKFSNHFLFQCLRGHPHMVSDI